MIQKRLISLLCLFFIQSSIFSQNQKPDSSISGFLFPLTYAVQFPQMDLANRFGTFSNVALSPKYKTATNWLLGLRGDFLFGNKVKEQGLLQGILNSNGAVISQSGEQVIVSTESRGFLLMLTFGKLWPVSKYNQNSGILLELGGGLMRHKIRFDWRDNQLPQLNKELLKGYDRLSVGPAGRIFFGYQYIGKGKARWVNLEFGTEIVWGKTSNWRGFNYDKGQIDNMKRNDVIWGLRFGYILPVLNYPPDDFYYY